MSFRVHLLRFRAEVTSPLRLPAAMGGALRGALFSALRRQFCLADRGPACGQPDLAIACPVCFLLAPVDTAEPRGRDVPRPYVLRAPTAGGPAYASGQTLEFWLTTFGRALSHVPYALLGVEEMGHHGIGAGRAGNFKLEEVWAENPLIGRQEAVYQRARGATVHLPSLPIDDEHVRQEVARLIGRGGGRRLTVDLVSPTRLIHERRLVKPEAFTFRVLLARLLERQSALRNRYGAPGNELTAATGLPLLAGAEAVQIVDRQLRWVELFRGSGRHGRSLPMSGLVGHVELAGELEPFLPWLVWGCLTHVGKDAAMGNGMLALEVPGDRPGS
jgi:hypothetical protein